MTRSRLLRRVLIGGSLVGVLGFTVWWGWKSAQQQLAAHVVKALGPNAQIGFLGVQGAAVVVRDVRLPGANGWPTDDQLRASEIRIRPNWRSVLGWVAHDQVIQLESITVTQAYLSVLRTRDGAIVLLPELLQRPAPTADRTSSLPGLVIREIRLGASVIEFVDASVRRTPHRMQLTELSVSLTDLALPRLAERSRLSLAGQIPGPRHTGRVTAEGWMVLGTLESDLKTRLDGLDLLTVQPYLVHATDTRITGGTADLVLHATVEQERLRAPGTLVLNQLRLAEGDSVRSTFMGAPRRLVLSALSDGQGRIKLDFTLSGHIRDPAFSLNETFGRELASAMAGQLGLSLDAVARGAGTVGQAAGRTVEQLGRSLQGLFRNRGE